MNTPLRVAENAIRRGGGVAVLAGWCSRWCRRSPAIVPGFSICYVFCAVLQEFQLVPEKGLEPLLPGGNRILSPARLPIPPLRHILEGGDYNMGYDLLGGIYLA